MPFTWGGAFESWARSFVGKNLWRTQRVIGSYEDGVQQCAMMFVHCNNRYGDVVNNDRWFMALFKTTVTHHWHSLARREDRYKAAEAIYQQMNEVGPFEENLMAAEQSMSPELAEVFSIIADGPREMIELLLKDAQTARAKIGQTRKLNNRWRRILGAKPDHDLVQELLQLLED